MSRKRYLTPENRDDFLRGHQDGLSDREDRVEISAYQSTKKELGSIPEEDDWYWDGYRAGFAGKSPKINLSH